MVSILVVGVGSMGWNHARVCSELGVLAGVCDKDEHAVKEVGIKFNTPSFTDVNEAINSLDLQGLIVATPTFTHVDVVKIGIENNLHILVEKPIADNYNNGKQMIEMANSSNVSLSVGQIERFNPVVGKAKELLESGQLGEIITICRFNVGYYKK